MFDRVLIANRGEIAVRVIRTIRRMGITSVAVYTDADRRSPHVEMADVAVPLGDSRGYLDLELLISVASSQGVDAIHPGYGFLSENAALARACAEAGIVFVGPPADAISAMGDKINAKRTVAASGVPVVPGTDEPGLDDRRLAAAALEIGLPVLLKPSAGGGGKGMRLVAEEADLAASIEAARREAGHAFGDDTLLVERYIHRPRHIEMQVFADTHGLCVALGERECSLQRRHQKIVEEAPSPLLDAPTRAAMAGSAVAAAEACGYVGAGTVEFIVSADRPDEYFFMEMNTRLQVEHPVTEAVTGLDLVEWQLRVACGEPLPWSSADDVPGPQGHAVEARIYTEDPARGFLPSAGRILLLREPSHMQHVRVDSGIRAGMEVGTLYDPMQSKVIAWGADRSAALRRLDRALAATALLGVTTNVGFLRRLLADTDVAAGRIDTGLVEERIRTLVLTAVPDRVLIAASLLEDALQPGRTEPAVATDPWDLRDGWRVSGPAPRRSRWSAGGSTTEVETIGSEVSVDGRPQGPCRADLIDHETLAVESGGLRHVYFFARDGQDIWLGEGGDAWLVRQELGVLMHPGGTDSGSGRVASPMPGTVIAIHVQPGSQVEAGDRLATVEAMKMEYSITASTAGTVKDVLVQAGQSVALDQPLLEIVDAQLDGGR